MTITGDTSPATGQSQDVSSGALQVAIIEDHALVVAGLKDVVASRGDMQLNLVSDDIGDLQSCADEVDLALVDLGLASGFIGVDDLRDVIDAGVKVIVVTGFAYPKLIHDLYMAGVVDVVSKAEPPELLSHALDKASVGDDSLSPAVAAAVANISVEDSKLSNREQEVLALYGSGLTIAAVASRLSVTDNTVKEYLKRIRLKLAEVGRPAPSQRDLYREAVREGLIKD